MPKTDPVKTILARYRKEGINKVKLALTDVDGVLRGKYLSLEKFAGLLPATGGFCDCVLGWDVADVLYDNAAFTGWHTGFPDAQYRLLTESERRIPGENTPFFLGEFVGQDGSTPHPVCPRTVLKRVLERAQKMGYGARLAAEYEFFVFNETPHSIREKNYTNLVPLTPGMFGYSVLRNTAEADLFTGLMDYCVEMDMALEGLHCETGPGVWEAALGHDEALAAADKAVLFKTFAKAFFQQRGLLATFMAKWSMDYPGQSGHIHQSLYSLKTSKPVFHKQGGRFNMSPVMESYVAGQQKYLKHFLALAAPTINDYTRLVKGAWAPTAATWGCDNRTVALRVIAGSEKSQRAEFRIGAASANPYLIMAVTLASGLQGVAEKLKLGEPTEGNAYEVQEQLPANHLLPTNLKEAAALFKQSPEAALWFGEAFRDHFASTREWEVREFERSVTDWELKRYLEII